MRVRGPYTLEELQKVATYTLREAMSNERSKRWSKVVQSYRRLLRLIGRQYLGEDFEPPPWYTKLMYELYYHLGLALQHAGDNKKAVMQYTSAIQAVSLPKNGCYAGCNSNSCLMTPIYARRAFAHACAGNLEAALKDAERAVVLDNKNPDVFCIRALVKNTMGNEREAIRDIEIALKYNPKHPCALMLHGSTSPAIIKVAWEDTEPVHHSHKKACSINPDCHNYLGVNSFSHAQAINFYDRFLYALSVPHTISEIRLPSTTQPHQPCREAQTRPPSGAPSSRPCRTRATSCDPTSAPTIPSSPHPSLAISFAFTESSVGAVTGRGGGNNPMKFRQPSRPSSATQRGFRCGTPTEHDASATALLRRREYGNAIRECMARPKTGDEFIAYLEKRCVPPKVEDKPPLPAPAASVVKTGSAIADDPIRTRPKSAKVMSSEHAVPRPLPRSSSTPGINKWQTVSAPSASGRRTRTTETPISIPASVSPPPRQFHLQAFTPLNLTDAPRMYYKPWNGDKLPMGEKVKMQEVLPFKC